MLNPSGQGSTAAEVIDGTITEFYNLMDQCIRRSEVMPGQYKSITSPSYSNNCPINESSFTTVDIGCAAPNVVDMDNSFITAKVRVPVSFPAGFKVSGKVCHFFVGWKSSLEFLEKYNIFCANKPVQDQVYVGEESYILQSLIPEHVRCRKPEQYTTWDNVQSFSPDVCGTYITLTSTDDQEVPGDLGAFTIWVDIPIKLHLNQFLLFQNFKYLLAFEGTWSIKMFPSSKHMIVCQVDPNNFLNATQKKALIGKDLSDFTHSFVQNGDTFKAINGLCFKSGAEVCSSADIKITIGKCRVDEVMYHQTQFELMYDIYDGLKARYMARPLAIPINKLEYGRFSGEMRNTGISSTYTVSIQNCDSMFIIPFVNDDHHTVCFNPEFKEFLMNISSYGNFPQQAFDTYGYGEKHIRFVNMTLDALNINNSPIMAPNKDLMNSLQGNRVSRIEVDGTNKSTSTQGNPLAQTDIKKQHDQSNFLIGIPFSNDIDFQGGLTSNGNISIKLTSSSSKIGDRHKELTGADQNQQKADVGATVMFNLDGGLFIKPLPYTDQPETRLVMERIV